MSVVKTVSKSQGSVSAANQSSSASTPRLPAPAVNTTSTNSMGQLVQEAVTDLRGPIGGAINAIRRVRDGKVGSINEQQRSLLSGALDQCEAVDFLAAEFARGEAESVVGTPQQRQWIHPQTIIQAVVEATSVIGQTRGVAMRVDSMLDSSIEVFVDPAAMVRLLANLVVAATRTSQPGQCVCLRAESELHGSSVRWSVIDKAPGMEPNQLSRLTRRGTSMSGSVGLGRTIARRLANAMHSTLTIQSDVRHGNGVSFSTPSGSIAAVASTYARWRFEIRPKSVRPRRRTPDATIAAVASESMRSSASQREAKTTIHLGPEWRRPICDDRVIVGTVSVGSLVPGGSVQSLESVLPRSISMFDLILQIQPTQFVFCLDARPRDGASRISEVNANVAAALPEMRLNWSTGSTLTIDRHGWAAQLTDLVIRQTLGNATSPSLIDPDEVRPGTRAMHGNSTATARLDAELRHLGRRLHRQTDMLRAQAAKLRRLP